jgi:membrane fusion protein (multidrug efflux system)
MNKRIIRIVAVVAVLLLISYLIADRAGAFDPAVDPEAANASPKAMTVNALRAEPRLLLDRVAATGSLMAEESIELMVETPGRIVKIGFEEGQNVAQGALLLKIDDEELQAQLRKANHQLKLARTQESRLVKLMKIQAVSQEELDKTITERMAFQADSASAACTDKQDGDPRPVQWNHRTAESESGTVCDGQFAHCRFGEDHSVEVGVLHS